MTPGRRPINLADRLQVHEDMRAVFGPNPDAMPPAAREIFLADADLIRASNPQEKP